MKTIEHKGNVLQLVDADSDEKSISLRKLCAKLSISFEQFTNGAEKSLRTGMLAQWKAGMKNRNIPDYGSPTVVVDVLATPFLDTKFDSGSIYFREPLGLILGMLDDDDEFVLLHLDSRRFEPYQGPPETEL